MCLCYVPTLPCFPDHHGNNPIVTLIQTLLAMAKKSLDSDGNDDVVNYISKCLGEIGCNDLSCVALPHGPSETNTIVSV